MMERILSENLKKFRAARGMTQEKVAAALNINAQTVSRWECGATLPDVLTLPELARLYGVTVDDFYKVHSAAYGNYAQRLASLYEKTMDPEDFLRCVLEFQKLEHDGSMSTNDKWELAATYHIMMCDCKEKALEWYDRVIADGPEASEHAWRRSRSMKNKLLFLLGQGKEVVHRQEERCAAAPGDQQERLFLVEAYMLAEEYEKAYEAFRAAAEAFPENWVFFIHGCNICSRLGKFDEALSCCDRAGELGTDYCSEYYARAECYQRMGEYEKAYQTYMEAAEIYRRSGYDVEADMVEEDARRILQEHEKD